MILLLAACEPSPLEPDSRVGDDSAVETSAPIDADGDGFTADADCDDEDALRSPDAEETCNGVDDDCDTWIDVGATDAESWFTDADEDGYGAGEAVVSCEPPLGRVSSSGDCDDGNASVSPAEPELCSTSADDDCDGAINEAEAADSQLWAPDVDGDTYGDAALAVGGCTGPESWIADAHDCDDADGAIHPGVRDTCNDGIDQDCDGSPRTCPYAGEIEMDAAVSSYHWSNGTTADFTSMQIGDVTGDGVRDVLVDYYYDATIAVIHDLGTSLGDVLMEDVAFMLSPAGARPAPSAVSGGSDLTGDGAPDLLFGYDADDTLFDNGGKVELIEGPILTSGDVPDPCATFYGEAEGDVLDQGFVGGDLNGDGQADLLLSASQWGDYEGAVYLLWGPIPCASITVAQADVSLHGEVSSAFGWDLSYADLDADGRVDLVVGDSGGAADAGAVRVFSADTLDSGARHPVESASWIGGGGGFGGQLDVEGDADGDGLPDLVSTAFIYGTSTFDQPGRVFLFYSPGLDSGRAEDADVTLDGGGGTNYQGGGHWAGDANGDGYSDLLVTDTYAGVGGVAYLFYGPVSGDVGWYTDADASFIAPEGGALGACGSQPGMYAAGDVDSDGDDEFVLDSGVDGGTIWLFHGGR